MGNYSESEFTQFSCHTTRPVIEPKKEKIKDLGGSSYLVEMKESDKLLGTCTGYSILKNQSDQNLSPAKITRPSSLMPLKCLPRGIGYAEAINAGKSLRNEDQAAFHRGVLRTRDLPNDEQYVTGNFDCSDMHKNRVVRYY